MGRSVLRPYGDRRNRVKAVLLLVRELEEVLGLQDF
jgi:hypothetical protein